MYTAQCVLGLIVLYVECTQSWDIALTHGNLLELYTNDIKTETVRFNSHKLAALAYDEVHNMLLYVDKQRDHDAICGYDISSRVNQCFIKRYGGNIRGISFDPVTEVVFFSDTNERSINWFSLKTGFNKYGNLLIKMDHGIPTDVAVDSCRGYVYWINTNLATPTIERARFNGSETQVILNINSFAINTTNKVEPHSLTIDQQTQRLYWIESTSIDDATIYYAHINGNEFIRTRLCYLVTSQTMLFQSSNTLTVSNTNLFYVHSSFSVWKLGKIKWTILEPIYVNADELTIGIAANYKIRGGLRDFNDCEALTTAEQNISEGPFCVHGVKVIGQSLCKCTPGYIGERCDVSECGNYCLQGNCSVNDEGLPICRCNAGYSGKRCEVDACHGYCSNNGDCSLNEKSEPVCQCKGDHAGDRCEVSNCVNYCIQGNCSFNDHGIPQCRCDAGYSGKRCEVDACHSFCLHNGDCSLNEKNEPVCQCKGDHAGDRCEVSGCLNYCIQGNCSFNDYGLPQCRCNTGYAGERCEVAACHGHCLNYGVCSLNEEDEPSCECVDGYLGSRCETVRNDNSPSL